MCYLNLQKWKILCAKNLPITKIILFFLILMGFNNAFVFTQEKSKKIQKNVTEIAEILKNTAQYCEKLEKAVLHFYCNERVTEKIERSIQYPEGQRGLKDFLEEKSENRSRIRNDSKKKTIKNVYTYDYQIIQDKTNIREQRILINENGKKIHQANPTQKTVLYTYKNTLIPILLFSKKNQQNYTFRVKTKTRIMGRRAHVISVSSNFSPEAVKNLATVWVDCQDFSILKFEVFPGAIRGYNNLLRINKNIMSDIKVTDSHFFGHVRNGIRYPNQTKISISFKTKASGKTESYMGRWLKTDYGKLIRFKISTSIRYKNYKFFDVTVNTKFKNL